MVLAMSPAMPPAHSRTWGQMHDKKARLFHLPSIIIFLSEFPLCREGAIAAPDRIDLVPNSSGAIPYLFSLSK